MRAKAWAVRLVVNSGGREDLALSSPPFGGIRGGLAARFIFLVEASTFANTADSTNVFVLGH